MGPWLFVARTQFARRVRAAIVLAIVTGVTAGIAVSLIAGARRSSTVVERYFDTATPYTLIVGAEGLGLGDMRAIPGVVRADPDAYVGMVKRGTTDGINGIALAPDAIDPTIQLIAGRHLSPNETDPVTTVNESFVSQFGLGVGDSLDVQMFADADRERIESGDYRASGPAYQFRIVGVVRTPADVALDEIYAPGASSAYSANNGILVPIGWYDAQGKKFVKFGTAYAVELAEPVNGRAAFEAAVRAAAPAGAEVQFAPPPFSERRASFDTPVDVETAVLLALGIAVALAAAVVVALLLRADERIHGRDQPVLQALGTTRVERGVIAAFRAAPAALLAALLTVVIGVVLSGRYPIGIGRLIELDPGISVDALVLTLGALAVVVAVVGIAFGLGWHGVCERGHPPARASVANRLARAGAPPDVVLGTNFAFQRSAVGGSVPTRSTIIGGAVAIAVVAAISIVVAGIDDLYERPAAHGWAWDIVVGNVNFDMPEDILDDLVADDRFAAAVPSRYGEALIGGESNEVLTIDDAEAAPPVMLSGRLPGNDREIVLGAALADELGTHIGSTVSFSIAGIDFDAERPADPLELEVVGIGLTPILGESELAETAIVDKDVITAAGGQPTPNMVMARFHANATPDTVVQEIRQDYPSEMMTDVIPARIVNLHRVRGLPLVGAALAAVLGAVLLLYTLAVGARVRTRELGVLRALGWSSKRLRRVLVWQGVLLAFVTLLIGIPLGLVAGVFAWRAIAEALGVADDLHLPAALLVLVPGAVVIGVVASLLPARRLRRQSVAALVRAE
jgi:putative ABC transport system permease protein